MRGAEGSSAQWDPRPYCPQAEGNCGSSEGGIREQTSPPPRAAHWRPDLRVGTITAHITPVASSAWEAKGTIF